MLICFLAAAKTRLQDCQNSLQKGDYTQAKVVCESSLHDSVDGSDDELNILLILIDIYHHLQNETKFNRTIELTRHHPAFSSNVAAQYNLHRKIGQKFYAQADFFTSKQHLYRAFQIAEQQDNPEWLSKSHNDMGLVELKLGNYTNALQHYQKSLKLKQLYGNDYQIGNTMNNLGLIMLQLEQPDEAVSYYEAALDHFLKYTQQDQFDQRVYSNIAHIYEDLTKAYWATNNTQKANYYAQEIVNSLNKKTNNSQHLRALINLSQWHLDNGNMDVLSQLINASDALIDKQANTEFEAQFRLLQAKMYRQQNKPLFAIKAIEAGMKITQQLDNAALQADFLLLKSQLLEQSNPQAALSAFKKYEHLRSQFLQQKYDSDLKTIQYQIKTQKIEQQLLNQELANSRQERKLQQLTNLALIVGLVFISLLALFVIFQLKRNREKQALMQSIRYHKQQLLVFQTSHNPNIIVSNDSQKEQLKKALVSLLIDAITLWEKTTQTSHIELAEQSKIWTVSIDNGTLRTRSLDKYLSIDKIPNNPKWRHVVQTGHFVLSQDNLSAQDRKVLESHLEHIMDVVRSLSLGKH